MLRADGFVYVSNSNAIFKVVPAVDLSPSQGDTVDTGKLTS